MNLLKSTALFLTLLLSSTTGFSAQVEETNYAGLIPYLSTLEVVGNIEALPGSTFAFLPMSNDQVQCKLRMTSRQPHRYYKAGTKFVLNGQSSDQNCAIDLFFTIESTISAYSLSCRNNAKEYKPCLNSVKSDLTIKQIRNAIDGYLKLELAPPVELEK